MLTRQNKIVFVVTTEGTNNYSVMTRIAIKTVRLTNPLLKIVVVCDMESNKALRKVFDPIINEVDEWLVIDTPLGDAYYRSRFIKTNLRVYIEGPFIYLDCDIVVRRNISEIYKLNCDIAVARNHSREKYSEQIWHSDIDILKNMNWNYGNTNYLNTGVIYYSNSKRAHLLGNEWHKLWLESYEKLNKYQDQPAFNNSILSIDPKIYLLPDSYNSQFKVTCSVALSASIWHYYASAQKKPNTCFEILTIKILSGKKVKMDEIKDLVTSNYPWRHNNIIDDIAAKKIVKRGVFNGWEAAWINRSFISYLVNLIFRRVMRITENIVWSVTK